MGACLGIAVFILFSAYGYRLGPFPSDTAWLISTMGTLVVVPSGYLVHKKLLPGTQQKGR